MLSAFFKYLSNNGLKFTLEKVVGYLRKKGLKSLLNRALQINKLSNFEHLIPNCSKESLISLPQFIVILYKDNRPSGQIIDEYNGLVESTVKFLDCSDLNAIVENLQFCTDLILYNFMQNSLASFINDEISRLNLRVKIIDNADNNLDLENVSNNKKKVLVVNCFYYPQSFGGATIVVEELNKIFYENTEYDFFTFTLGTTANKELYGKVLRYESYKQNVFAYFKDKLAQSDSTENKLEFISVFEKLLAILKPDLVHFHSIQGMGEDMINVCEKNKIKNLVTCHDFWWLTDKQFISTLNFRENKKISDDIIANYFLKDKKSLVLKRTETLKNTDLILAPSLFLENVLVKMDFQNVRLNKNGIKYPLNFKNTMDSENLDEVVYGFLGGKSEIKGYNFVIEAFKKINSNKIKLLIVDNTTSLGFSSFNATDFEGITNFEIIPAFKQDQMDDFYSKIQVLLYPSLAIESFGLAPREASIRNIKVIATDVGGISEDRNELHYVIKPHFTADDLYEKILEVHEHVSSNSNLIFKKVIHTDFDFQANELLSIYDSLIPNDNIQKSEI